MKSKYGYLIPNNHEEAVWLDEVNGNTLWQDAETAESDAMFSYKVFGNRGKNGKIPCGYKLIRLRMIYDVKHNGRHKARLVASGHLTPIPVDSIYSGFWCGISLWTTDSYILGGIESPIIMGR
jgi:hypothetical protein